jgi:hypothetical protein
MVAVASRKSDSHLSSEVSMARAVESGRERESGLVVESGRVVDSSRVVESSLAVGLKQCSLERELVAGRRSEHMAVVGRVMGRRRNAPFWRRYGGGRQAKERNV